MLKLIESRIQNLEPRRMQKSFKELIVWQKAKDLAILIYGATSDFPKSELFGLTNQMRRSVISISSNIAESYHRYNKKEKDQFLKIAYGSAAELESQINIASILFNDVNLKECEDLLVKCKILNKWINSKF